METDRNKHCEAIAYKNTFGTVTVEPVCLKQELGAKETFFSCAQEAVCTPGGPFALRCQAIVPMSDQSQN